MIRMATLVGTAGLLLSTSAMAQEVSYDFDKTANFAAFETYAWVPGVNLTDELNHKRVVAAVDAQLTSKGLRQKGSNPDVLVAYHARVSRDLEVAGDAWGGYRRAGWGRARVEEVLVGTLVIEMVDARTGRVVWRGVATKDLDTNASPEKREKNISKAAEKVFKKYPPVL